MSSSDTACKSTFQRLKAVSSPPCLSAPFKYDCVYYVYLCMNGPLYREWVCSGKIIDDFPAVPFLLFLWCVE